MGDVVLAWVDGSHYVVHRVIGITPKGDISLMGDGNIRGVEHCTQNDIVGKAIYVVGADERKRPLPNDCWQWKLWNKLRPVRRWILAIYRRTILKMI